MTVNNLPELNPTQPNSIKGKVRLPGVGLAILFGAFFFMTLVVGFIQLITIGENSTSTSALRILTVVQDICVFILPAIGAAFFVTRLPATFLGIDKKLNIRHLLMASLILIASIPAMDWIVNLNESIHLPESMASFEATLRGLEYAAEQAIKTLLGPSNAINIIISVLIIGLLTGVSEELFFRGAFQNLLCSTRLNKHLAIWITAIVFSTLHFEFFGFLPRMLLGAYFGYLLWWTGCLWLPILIHALNNSMVVVFTQLTDASTEAEAVGDAVESSLFNAPVTIILSGVVTCLGLYILRRMCTGKSTQTA